MSKTKREPFPPDSPLMTIEQAASYLGKSVSTLYGYISKGIGPTYIKDGGISYFRSDLEAYLENRRVIPRHAEG